MVSGYQYTDSQAMVFTGTPAITTTATQTSPSGNYTVAPVTGSLALTSLGSTNYTVTPVSTGFTITGNVPQAIIFPALAEPAAWQLVQTGRADHIGATGCLCRDLRQRQHHRWLNS